MQRDPWGRPIRGARFENPWFDPPPPRRDPYAAERAAIEAERARAAALRSEAHRHEILRAEARRNEALRAESLRTASPPFADPPSSREPSPFAPPSPREATPREAVPREPQREPVQREPVSEPSPPREAQSAQPIAAPRAEVDRNDVRRAIAELEATKERFAREAKRNEEASRMKLVGELLPVLDDLDRSLASGSSDKGLLQGVELVRQGLERVLAGYGLQRIQALNETFDPAKHEAIAVAPVTDPALDGVVVDEIGRGYRIGEKVQRPARVRVGQLVA